jgi:ATP phosphoribosyltransferase
VGDVLDFGACLVAHRPSWESKDLSPLLTRLCAAAGEPPAPGAVPPAAAVTDRPGRAAPEAPGSLWLALPDGHQQKPALEFLARAGITVSEDPPDPRRPRINLEGTRVKVIRPQDMPLQVANGNFDLAVTGEDWLADHLYQFPSSPVRKLLALPFGRVRIVAVVSKRTPFRSPRDLEAPLRRQEIGALRIASEYINIADRYARENHLSPCRLIPTWGATEAFLPEDADLLIENTQTGRTLAQHGLRIIDTLFESSACLIGRTAAAAGAGEKRMAGILQRLERTSRES